VIPEVPVAARGGNRWIVPTVVVGLLVLGAAVVLGVFVIVGRSSGEGTTSSSGTLVTEARTRIVPVRDANETLRDALLSATGSDDLSGVSRAAERLRVAARDARVALDALGGDAAGSQTVAAALAAVGSFGITVAAAADDITPTTLARARVARAEVIAKQSTLRRADPALASATAVSVPSLAPLTAIQRQITVSRARARARASAVAQAGNTARAAARAYVREIDGLLVDSARTRRDLGTLIAGVTSNRLVSYDASSQIASILAQRQNLLGSVSVVSAPSAFVRSADLLRSSVAAAIDDDRAIQGWIGAWYAGDQYTFDRYWADHTRATARASAAKAAFVAEYDRVRARFGLGRLSVGNRY